MTIDQIHTAAVASSGVAFHWWLILGGVFGLICFFVGCFVGHRTGRNEGSDSANRWEATYSGNMEGWDD